MGYGPLEKMEFLEVIVLFPNFIQARIHKTVKNLKCSDI